MSIGDALVQLLGALSLLSFLAALITWAINKWSDQGGVGEKAMMGCIGAGTAFAIGAIFVTANAGQLFPTV